METIKQMLYPDGTKLQEFMHEKKEIMKKNNLEAETYIISNQKLKEIPWIYNAEDRTYIQGKKMLYPSIMHSYRLYKGLCFAMGICDQNKQACTSFFNRTQVDPIRDILIHCVEWVNKQTDCDYDKVPQVYQERIKAILEKNGLEHKGFCLVKGSVYKIKRYFLESNNIRDIRGGSIIVDYLNNQYVQEYLNNQANGLCEECLIYSGGGNVLMIVPEDKAQYLCENMEKAYQDIGLTVMNAFEYIHTDIYKFLFQYREEMGRLEYKLKEREKVKIYNYELKGSAIDKLQIGKTSVPFETHQAAKHRVCQLCNCRDAYYEIEGKNESVRYACTSCYRKYKVGDKAKSKFRREFEDYLAQKGRKDLGKDLRTLDYLQDSNGMIAVIYGDGNNMGQYVMNISAPFEMMYFSDKTDQVTKESVYAAIYETMGEKAAFEILAVGGDDLFFIIPAEYAPSLARRVIEHFDNAFLHQATMSIGICIGKYNTPVRTMFEIAMDNLKEAKKLVKKNLEYARQEKGALPNEGTVDIIELTGAQNIINDKNYQGIFPMRVSTLKRALNNIQQMEEYKLRLTDYNYAKQNMIPEEFKAYFAYKEAKNKKHVYRLVNDIFEEDIEQYLQTHNPWAELLVLMKYGKGTTDAASVLESTN